jgi:hypothetical protein
MCVRDENSIYAPQAVFRKPFNGGWLETFADIDNNSPEI